MPAIDGSIDFETGAFSVSLRKFDTQFGDILQVMGEPIGEEPAALLAFDPRFGAEQVLLSSAQLTATSPLLDSNGLSPSFTLRNAGIRASGAPFVSAAEVSIPPGYELASGVGGLLPLEVNSVGLTFPDPDDFNALELQLGGRIEVEELQQPLRNALGDDDLTLLASIGADASDTGEFDFSVSIDSLQDGDFRPNDLGPITLGIQNLDVQNLTLGGEITFAGFEDGVLQSGVSGLFTVTSDQEATDGNGFSGLQIAIDPTSRVLTTTEADGTIVTRIDVDATVNLDSAGFSGSLGGVQISGGELKLDLLLETASLDVAPFVEVRNASIAVAEVQIDAATIEVGDFIHMTLRDIAAVADPEPGEANFQVGLVDITSPMLPSLSGQATNVALFDDPALDDDRRLVFETTTVALDGSVGPLDNLMLDLTGFEFNLDTGVFLADAIKLRVTDGVGNAIGLAEVLPFDITEIGAEFDAGETTLMATGLFQPIEISDPTAGDVTFYVRVGNDGANPQRFDFGTERPFSFSFHVVADGNDFAIQPVDIPTIGLGFDDLELFDTIQLEAFIELGTYPPADESSSGFAGDFGGGVSVTSLADGVNFSDAAFTFDGTFDPTRASRQIDGSATLSVASLEPPLPGMSLAIANASADFDFAISVGDEFAFRFDEFRLTEFELGQLDVNFGDPDPLLSFAASDVTLNLTDAGANLLEVGEMTAALGSGVPEPLANLGGTVRNFGLDREFNPVLGLDQGDFSARFSDLPSLSDLGLPDFVAVDSLDVSFGDLTSGFRFDQLVLTVSGGVELPLPVPVNATVDDLTINLGRLGEGDLLNAFDLAGFHVDVGTADDQIELGPLSFFGGVSLERVDFDVPEESNSQSSLVSRVSGSFQVAGFGGGIDLVFTEYGPIAASVSVDVGDQGFPIGTTGVSIFGGNGRILFNETPRDLPADPDCLLTEDPEICDDPGNTDDFDLRDLAGPFSLDDPFIDQRVKPLLIENFGADTPTLTFQTPFLFALGADLGLTGITRDVFSASITLGASVNFTDEDLKIVGLGSAQLSGYQLGTVGAVLELDDTPVFQLAIQAPPSDLDLAAGQKSIAEVIPAQLIASLTFRKGDNPDTEIVESDDQLSLSIDGRLTIDNPTPGQQPILQASTSGVFVLNDEGFFGALQLDVDATITEGVQLIGEADLAINLTANDQTLTLQGEQEVIPQESMRLLVAGQLSAGPMVVDGRFLMEIEPDRFLVAAAGSLDIGSFELDVVGAFLVETGRNGGMAGGLRIEAGLELGEILDFRGNVLFQFNTFGGGLTGSRTIEIPGLNPEDTVVVELPAADEQNANLFQFAIGGSLSVFPTEGDRPFGVDAEGEFTLLLNGDDLMLTFFTQVDVIVLNTTVVTGNVDAVLNIVDERVSGTLDGNVSIGPFTGNVSVELSEYGCLTATGNVLPFAPYEIGNCGAQITVRDQISSTNPELAVRLDKPAEDDLTVVARIADNAFSSDVTVAIGAGERMGRIELPSSLRQRILDGNLEQFDVAIRSAEYAPSLFKPADPQLPAKATVVSVVYPTINVDVDFNVPTRRIGDAVTVEMLESDAPLEITLTASADRPVPFGSTVDVRFNAGSSINSDQFQLNSQFVSLPIGQTVTLPFRGDFTFPSVPGTFVIDPIDDKLFEPTDNVQVLLQVVNSPSPGSTFLSTSRVDILLQDDDPEVPRDAVAFYGFDITEFTTDGPFGPIQLDVCCAPTAEATFVHSDVAAAPAQAGKVTTVGPFELPRVITGPPTFLPEGVEKPAPNASDFSHAIANAHWDDEISRTNFYEFAVTADAGKVATLNGIDFWERRELENLPSQLLDPSPEGGDLNGPVHWELRSSEDGFATAMVRGISVGNKFANQRASFEPIVLNGGESATFRLYGVEFRANETENIPWIVDNVAILGTTAAEQLPKAFPDKFAISENRSISDSVAKNDRFLGQTPNFELLKESKFLDFRSDGSFTFTPARNDNGLFTFEYLISNEIGESSVATLSIDVKAVNSRPVVTDPAPRTVVSGIKDKITIRLSASDVETPNSQLNFRIVRQPAVGSVTIDGRDAIYTPPSGGLKQNVSFTFAAKDNGDPPGVGSRQSLPGKAQINVRTTVPRFTFKGSAIKSYIANGTVFFDANRNGVLDYLDTNANGVQDFDEPSEPSTNTELDGSYELIIPDAFDLNANGVIDKDDGVLAIQGGTISGSNVPLEQTLTAWPTTSLVTPLNTVVAKLVEDFGFTIADANDFIAERFSNGINPGVLESIEGVVEGDLGAVVAEVSAVSIYSTIEILAAAGEASGLTSQMARSRVLDSIAILLVAGELDVTLNNADQLQQILNLSLAEAPNTLSGDALDATVLAAIGVNREAASYIADGLAGSNLLVALAKLEKDVSQFVKPLLLAVYAGQSSIDDVEAQMSADAMEIRRSTVEIGPVLPTYVSAADVTVVEGDAGLQQAEIVVQLSQASSLPVAVQFVTESDSANDNVDFSTKTGTIEFEPGETEKSVRVDVRGDERAEIDEIFRVRFTAADNAIIRDHSAAVEIVDDDLMEAVASPQFIERVANAIRRETGNLGYDYNDDDQLSAADFDYLIDEVLRVKPGDSDMNGVVDFGDFLVLSSHFGELDSTWADGNFGLDITVDFEDFLLLSSNFGR